MQHFCLQDISNQGTLQAGRKQYVAYVGNNFLVPEDFNITSSIWKYEKLDKWENVA